MAQYLIQDTTLTNIADAIREKTGDTGSILPGDMPNHILNIQSTDEVFAHSGIPSYVKEEALSVAAKVKSVQTENTLTFIAMSDSHQDFTNNNIINGNAHAGMAAKVLAYALDLDFCAFLGDYTVGSGTTTLEDGRGHIADINRFISDAFTGIPNFRTVGNHDPLGYSTSQTGGYLSTAELYQYIGSYNNDGTTVMGSTELGYCYRDFTSKKIRVICLNSSDEPDLSGGAEGVSATQQAWLCTTLRNTPSGYKIIVLSHHPLDWGNVCSAANILYQFSIKGSYSVSGTKYDFSSSGATIACAVHGHVHGFKEDYLHYISNSVGYPSSIKRIATPNMCFNRNNEYGNNNGQAEYFGIEFGQDTTYNKTANTAKDTAFVVNVYNPDTNYLHSFCYGAGYDRIVDCGSDLATYQVQLNFTGGILSNPVTTVVEGSTYSTTITAIEGYEIETISVLMGGVDITSECYSNGQITIANVTGDIVINGTVHLIAENTITYDLANVSSSSFASSAKTGDPYSTTLTADEGFEINFVRVLMGGVDITSSVYNANSKFIGIEEVTGNVEVIAGYYTNLVPTATTMYGDTEIYNGVGYCNDKYVSSGAAYKDNAGTVAVGYLLMSPSDVIYIKGADLTTDTHVRMYTQTTTGSAYMYSAEGVDITTGVWLNSVGSKTAFYVEKLGDKYYKLYANTDGQFAEANYYYRISLYGTGERLIITHNEPIATRVVVNNLVTTSLDPNNTSAIFNGTGYKDGYYIGGTSTNGSAPGYTSTGGIYLPEGVSTIYIKGAEWDATAYTRLYIGTTDNPGHYSSYAYRGDYAGDGTASDINKFGTITVLGDKYFKITYKPSSGITLNRYYRMTLKGSGADLIITHDQPIPEGAISGGTTPVNYTVTNTLTNVVNSNTNTSIASGSTYSATLTASSGYTLTGGTVNITMGGMDITSSAYSGNVISISNVTGNIVITASAVKDEVAVTDNNLVNKAESLNSSDPYGEDYNGDGVADGYKKDYRLSSSAPYESQKTGYVSTGWIPYAFNPSNVIYIRGAILDTSDSYCRIHGWNGKTGVSSQFGGYGEGSTINNYYTIEQPEGSGVNYYKLTPKGTTAQITYIRMSLKYTNENLVITVNEPIV